MKSDINKYKKFIIVDDNNKPMSWEQNQLCYCTNNNWKDIHFPIKLYSKKRALELILKSNKWREKQGYSLNNYSIMPIYNK